MLIYAQDYIVSKCGCVAENAAGCLCVHDCAHQCKNKNKMEESLDCVLFFVDLMLCVKFHLFLECPATFLLPYCCLALIKMCY